MIGDALHRVYYSEILFAVLLFIWLALLAICRRCCVVYLWGSLLSLIREASLLVFLWRLRRYLANCVRLYLVALRAICEGIFFC